MTPENPTISELKDQLEATELDSMARQVEGRLGRENPLGSSEEE